MIQATIYISGDSVIHRLSPVTKILSLLMLFALSVLSSAILYQLLLTFLVLVLLFTSRNQSAIRHIRVLLFLLMVFPVIMWSLYMDGSYVLLGWKGVQVSKEGLMYGICMGLRLTSMLIAGLILLTTTRIEEFTAGLKYLGVPYRMGFALSLAFRLVPFFFQSFSLILQAQQSRGLDIHTGSWLRRIRATLPVFIPVLVLGLRQTDQLAIALESKGFGFSRQRTNLFPVSMMFLDWMICAAFGILLIGVIIWRFCA